MKTTEKEVGTINVKEIQLTDMEEEIVKSDEEKVKKLLDEIITKIEITTELKMSFCTNVGCEGLQAICLMVFKSSLFVYVIYEYSGNFTYFEREFLWLFATLSCLYLLISFYHIILWKQKAKQLLRMEIGSEIPTKWYEKIKYKYDQKLSKYYLWQLYIMEMVESFNHLYNFLNIYTCSLPVSWSLFMCIILSSESFFLAYFMISLKTPASIGRQAKLDLFVDLICIVLPLAVMWFGYNVPVSIDEMARLTLVPGFTILKRLVTLLEEIIHRRTARTLLKAENKVAKKAKRRRQSLFGDLGVFSLAKQQHDAVPRAVHVAAGIVQAIFGSFLLCTAISHIAMSAGFGRKCEPLLWEKCYVKTPYCKNIFTPTCNCAVLTTSKHNWTQLPDGMNDMTALKVMRITNGPLEKLPDDFNKKFQYLSLLNLDYNHLTEVPVDMGNLKLTKVYLRNNALGALPDNVWGNKYTVQLYLENNMISRISPSIQAAITLRTVSLSNNSLVELPEEFFPIQSLGNFLLDGNNLTQIPTAIGKLRSLHTLNLNNNRIMKVVDSIGNLASLRTLDLRNNTIHKLPKQIVNLKKSLKYIYLHNNPVCTNGWLEGEKDIKALVERQPGAGCDKQCSIYCQDRFKSNNYCAANCNTELCNFDGGDCL